MYAFQRKLIRRKKAKALNLRCKALDGGRINIATCSIGTAQAALNTAREYLKERTQFGKPLAAFQALQFKIADMNTELVAARQMVRLRRLNLILTTVKKPLTAPWLNALLPMLVLPCVTTRCKFMVVTVT